MQMTDHDKRADQFWNRLDDVNAGMLGTTEDPRLVPMSHYADRDQSTLWFIGAKGTDLAKTLAGGPKDAIHVVTDAGEGLYTRIHGSLALSDDRAKLDEIWNAVASSWFVKMSTPLKLENTRTEPQLYLLTEKCSVGLARECC